jgi:hypothetical protein
MYLMEKEVKDLLIKILANQAVIYKKVSIIENRSTTFFGVPEDTAYVNKLNKEAEGMIAYIEQIVGE